MNKIVFLVSSIKNRSGVERVVSVLANQLCNICDIEIINRDTLFKDSAYPLNSKIKITRLPGNMLTFYLSLRKYLINNPCDLVIVHNMGKLSLLASYLPAKIRLWSYEHVARTSRSNWLNFLARTRYHRYEKVLTITANDALSYQKEGIIADVIYNPSPYELYSNYKQSSKNIISLGRLVHQKGFDNLIKAWSLIENNYPDWHLYIYGDGTEYKHLHEQIIEHNLTNIFLLSGVENVEDIYKNASFYVMSSRYEGLPMVLIEAQTFALPIVSFDCPFGPSEMIQDGYNGLLIENQNVEKLAKGIEKMILEPEIRKVFSNNAFESAKRFSVDKILLDWQNLLN